MKELILTLNKHLRVTDCKITNNEITFHASSTLDHAYCPDCSQPSSSVHDCYMTRIQDLPIQGKTVYLYLIVRRFKCQCTTCSKKTFSETFPFKAPNAKKTIRLMNLIIDLAESRSASGMTRDLKELGILVKKSSLCNYLGQKKNPSELSCI